MELAYSDRQRLDRLEAQTASFEARLARVERITGVKLPEPPPVIRDRPAVSIPRPVPVPPVARPEPAEERERPDLELALGSRGLLWVGGLVTVLGLAYLVGLAINRGLITPTTQFVGEIILCLAFIGVGLWKRPQRVEFGDLLVGLGSCGMYLSFAAGHLDKHLYSSEAVVGLFVGLSAINVLYGAWRGAQAFVGIGLLGGLIASGMPLQKPDGLPLSVSLSLLALIPVLIVGAIRRWPSIVFGGWLLFIPFSGVIVFGPGDWPWRVGGLAVGTLAALAAFVCGRKSEDHVLLDTFGWLAIPGTALVVGFYAPGLWMSAIVGAFAAVALGLGWWAKRVELGEGLIQVSVATAFVIVPFGWSHFQTSAIFIALSLAATLIGTRWRPRDGALLSAAGLGFALYAYLFAAAARLPQMSEIAIVIALMAALGGAIWIGSRARVGLPPLVVGALIGAPLVMRLAVLFLHAPGTLSVLSASAFGGAVYASMLVICASTRRSQGVWAAAWAVFIFAFFAWLLDLISGVSMPNEFATPMLLLFLISASLLAIGARHVGLAEGEGTLQGFAAFFFGVLWLRLAVLALPFESVCAIAWGALTFALGISVAAARFRRHSLMFNGYAAFGVACYAYAMIESIPWGHRIGLVAFGLVVLVALTLAGILEKGERPAVLNAAAFAGMWVVTQLVWVLLTNSNLAVTGQGSMTIGMTVYALLLIGLGFAFRERILRYWSLGVFAASAMKVVLIDLADLDAALRVLVLMGLGVAMIAGAYAYIRYERRLMAKIES